GGSMAGGSAGGSIGGGSAGGSIGGGSAGGSIGGGSAGGSIGGGSAGGGPLDTYVCLTCAGSLDTNPGTQASPFRTIARGIAVAQQLGRPTVFVGAAQGTFTAYAETVTVPAGVVVQGRWTVSSTFSWTRTGNRTLLINLTTSGVTFAPGAGRTSGLDGIRVQSSGAISGATTVAAISIVDASPTLRDFEVDPPGGNLPSPATAAGVSVVGSASSTSRPNPRLEGLMNARSDVQAGAASTNSFGLVVNNASVDTEFLDVRGGNTSSSSLLSPATSSGLFLIDGAGTSFRASTATSGTASGGTCAGIAASGNTSNVVIDQSEARGCTGIPGGLTPPLASIGVSFSNCTAIGPGSGNPRLAGTFVQGGVAQGPNSFAVGVLASNGCPLQIEGNSIAGSNAVTLVPQSAAGVICTHEQQSGVAGANSSCRIANNNRGITGGRAIQVSIGLACVGNCATGTASCTGSCTEVFNNSASGQDARLVIHGLVTQSSPRIARNTFGGDGQQCTNTGGSNPFLYGLRLEGSSSRVENNLVIGGVCPSVIAFEQANVRRSGDMSAPAPDVHSNTFVPVTGGAAIGMSTLIVGVAVRSQSPVAVFSPMGSYRNNIITALGFAAVRFAFQEADASSDPAVLEHNDFWAPTIAGMPPLYLNEGTTTLNGAGQINGLNGMGVSAFNNLSNDPGFIANFRISTVSQMRAAGGIAGAPFDDIDGQRRPLPLNTAPDIGCDETQ
ncbi:MAG: hypothetical protein Q8N26_22920, partial [Myxococcales bacterium]|nr:hypothetical protein [Myxococcales bacterium]